MDDFFCVELQAQEPSPARLRSKCSIFGKSESPFRFFSCCAIAGPFLSSLGIEEATERCVSEYVRAKATRTEAAIWLLQLRDGLEIKGKSELPADKRPVAAAVIAAS